MRSRVSITRRGGRNATIADQAAAARRFPVTARAGRLFVAAALAAGAGYGVPAVARAASPATQQIAVDVIPGLNHLTVAGEPAASQRLTLGIALAEPDPAGRAALMRALYDPASPMYHRFLSVGELSALFGVDPATSARVLSWLRSGGLDVVSVAATRDAIVATGTMAQVESLMQVTERLYRSVQGRVFLANDVAPTVPAGDSITTVMGLNSWQHAATPKRTTTTAACIVIVSSCPPIEPEQLWSIYDLPSQYTGQGQRISILGEGVLGSETHKGDVLNDLRLFEDEHHFPHIPITVHCVVNNDCGTDQSGAGEWDLDEAASTGMAPNADHLTFYFAQDLTDAGQMAMISTWLSDPTGSLQANASFAECEAGPYNGIIYPLPGNVDGGTGILTPILGGPTGIQAGDNLEAYAEPALQNAALMGRTLFAAAGDTGPGCDVVVVAGFGTNGTAPSLFPAASYPAGARYAVAAGGTTLTPTGGSPTRRGSESAWRFTGGGASLFLTAPDYQRNVANLTLTCIIGPNGEQSANGQLCRGTPDVAAMSIGASGYSDVSGGSDSTNGGTSLSSPLLVGMWTRIQQASGSARGLGFANFTFYTLGRNPVTYARDFFDVTTGNAGPGADCPGADCTATTGWDYASGWGVPDVANLAKDAASAPAVSPSPSLLPPLPPITGAAGLANTSGAALPAGAVALAGLLLLAGTAIAGRRRRATRG